MTKLLDSKMKQVLSDPLSGYMTRSQVDNREELYREVLVEAGAFPTGLRMDSSGITIGMPPTNAIAGVFRNEYTAKILNAYATVTGTAKPPKEILDAIKGINLNFDFDFKDVEISKWVSIGSGASSTGLAQSGVNAEFTSGTIKAGTIVAESLAKDGFIDDKETMNIAMTAGSTIGGVIGSIFPGVGTVVGALVGTGVGALVGAIVGAASKPNWKDAVASSEKKAAAAQKHLIQECLKIQDTYNASLLEHIFKLSTRWINAEMTLGYRIPLRWFDPNPGLLFEFAAHASRPDYIQRMPPATPTNRLDGRDYTRGRFKCFTWDATRQGMFDYRGRNFRPMGHERIGMCNFYCPDKILGCLYPLINVNEFDLYGAGRVVAALDARGYKMPADLGCRKCAAGVIHGNCIPIATDIVKPTNSKKDSDVEKYEKEVDAAIKRTYGYPTKRAEAQFKGFQAAINVVSTDLTRTLALMQSQQSILLNQTTLAGTGVLSDSGSRFAGARSDHVRNMKYLAIGGGAALMAAALFKGFR